MSNYEGREVMTDHTHMTQSANGGQHAEPCKCDRPIHELQLVARVVELEQALGAIVARVKGRHPADVSGREWPLYHIARRALGRGDSHE